MWVRVDDKFHDHEKVRLLLELYEGDAVTAIGLWTLSATWCGDQMSDGVISGFVLGRWRPDWKVYAQMLVEVGLWHEVDIGGRPHVEFHDWGVYNPSKAKAADDAAVHARKVALHRDPQLVAAIRARDQERCRYCGAGVDFNDRRSALGGTYDHVDPDGPNNLHNVVVACRGCNSAKGHRTPDEWGYALLKPGSMGPARRVRVVSETDLDTSQNVEGSHAGRVGPGTGRVGSGSETYPDTGAEPGTKSKRGSGAA